MSQIFSSLESTYTDRLQQHATHVWIKVLTPCSRRASCWCQFQWSDAERISDQVTWCQRGQSSGDVPYICFSCWEPQMWEQGAECIPTGTRRTFSALRLTAFHCEVRLSDAWMFHTQERHIIQRPQSPRIKAFDLLLFCRPCQVNDWLTMSYFSSRPAERSPVL